MLEELLQYDRLGSLEQLEFLIFHALEGSESKKLTEIKIYCLNKSADFYYSFNGLIKLLEYTQLIKINPDSSIIILPETSKLFNKSSADRVSLLIKNLCEQIFAGLLRDGMLADFFVWAGVDYDVESAILLVKNSYIKLKYTGIKNFLLNSKFFLVDTSRPGLLQISENYQGYFENFIIPKIKTVEDKISHEMSPEELQSMQKAQALAGLHAEEFVFKYEIKRLEGHPKIKLVKRISEIICNSGYDIVSFKGLTSKEPDLFIEVKSYAKGQMSFYWSKNEMETAKTKGDDYAIYIVDRDLMELPDYNPDKVINPYEKVFLNIKDWDKSPQSWFFQKKM